MRKYTAGPGRQSNTPMWESLEGLVREKAQELIQQILEEEITELLGRQKSERRAGVSASPGYRESTDSWAEVIRDLKARGLGAPKLLLADGNAAVSLLPLWSPLSVEIRCPRYGVNSTSP